MFWFLHFLAAAGVYYYVQEPVISELDPQGLRFAYPDDGSEALVSYHYSVNVPISGVAAGQWNFDVSVPTNGYFVHENKNVKVQEGDVVYYWINVITTDNIGYSDTDLSWVVSGSSTTTKGPAISTTTEATTEGPSVSTTTTEIHPTQPTQAPVEPETQAPGSSGTVDAGCSSYPCSSSCDLTAAPCNGLIFEELWDDLDMDVWQHEITMGGGGNWEFEYYNNNRSNSYVRDNTLFIKPTLTTDKYGEGFLSTGTIDLWGASPADMCTGNSFYGCSRSGNGANYLNPIQSARLRTVESFSCKFCRVEVEAKMPTGDWIWPAIWMLPKHNKYGQWPASGEFDLVESRGNADLKDSTGNSQGNDAVGSTMHWGPWFPLNGYEKTTAQLHGTFAQEFHKYTLDWTEDGAVFYIDGQELLNVNPGQEGFWPLGEFEDSNPGIDNPWVGSKSKMAPFDQEFYILMNVAVGGTNGFFQDSWTNGNGPKPWANTSPTAFKDFYDAKDSWYPTWQPEVNNGENAAMQVKSVRVWQN